MLLNFKDGLTNLFNSLANSRNATTSNVMVSSPRVSFQELTAIYETGIGGKIVSIKAGNALKSNSIIFKDDSQKDFYVDNIQRDLKEALLWALVFGRGIIVINDGGDLNQELSSSIDLDNVKFDVFSGDMVNVTSYEMDLSKDRYLKPITYNVNGYSFHHSRIIDLTYVKPTQQKAPLYGFGGMSEYERIYHQLINDGIVERASASILEKNSSFFYKVKDFTEKLANKDGVKELLEFYRISENQRSIYGAGIVDKETDVVSISQSLSNLKEADDISLRRIALVTSIPLPMLVGESVSGLNSSGQQEKTSFNEMIEHLQQDYILPALNELMFKLGFDRVVFKDNQNVTPLEKIEYETKVIDNASKLYNLGYDISDYFEEKGMKVKARDDFNNEFSLDELEDV